ncbi:MAG: DUF4249 family protein [Candidatus Limimorpha sp.]
MVKNKVSNIMRCGIILFASMFIFSCNTKVDVFSEGKETTVVYAMLDPEADTNFIKITKSIIGNIAEAGQDYSQNNYEYNEIDVILRQEKKLDTIHLDTVWKWLPYNPDAPFYSGCRQMYYYTTEKLQEGEEYGLYITKQDGTVVSSKAKTVKAFNITKPSVQINLNTYNSIIEWRPENVSNDIHDIAAYFEVAAIFHYDEMMPGATEYVSRSIVWPLKSGKADSFINDRIFTFSFSPNAFYSILESNEYINQNSPAGVKRVVRDFEIKITAASDELYNYIIINNSSSAIQDTPNYSNITNGTGLMAARVIHNKLIKVMDNSRKHLHDNYPQYGFIYPDAGE